jgi:serine phosphatase RsbU (regulator of sigma subunit)
MGGAGRFRFGTPRFMEMLVEQSDKPLKEQKKVFLKTLRDFKGDTEQIDDITLIGFRL